MPWKPKIVGGTDHETYLQEESFKRLASAYVEANKNIIDDAFPEGQYSILIIETRSLKLRKHFECLTRGLQQRRQALPFTLWPGKSTDKKKYLVTACCGGDQTLSYGSVPEYLANKCEEYINIGREASPPLTHYIFERYHLFNAIEHHEMMDSF